MNNGKSSSNSHCDSMGWGSPGFESQVIDKDKTMLALFDYGLTRIGVC